MGFFKNEKGSLISDYFYLVIDVAHLKANNIYNVILYNDYLELKAPSDNIKLNYSQITDVYYGLYTQIVSKSKSTIGRAVAGGLLFGEAGAIIGAISGIGIKKKKRKKYMFIISYISRDGQDAFICFEDTRMYKGANVAQKLKELCNIASTEYL